MREVPFGPTGEVVYTRTYSRDKADGTKETWPETVDRVVSGNIALVHGDDRSKWTTETLQEADALRGYMRDFAIIPGGRHLWASGVPGRQYLFNCHVAGWGVLPAEHFEFTFLRLMEGGGVGSNYSSKHLSRYGDPRRTLDIHFVCRPDHPDYDELKPYLSTRYEYANGGEFRGTVADSREGWADALSELIGVYFYDHWLFGEQPVIYDVSGIRCSGSELKTFGGTASGPAPFAKMMLEVSSILNRGKFSGIAAMEIDHAIAECVVSGGNRRSARMAIMHWDDPEIARFLKCKQDTGKHWTTNISVEVDDEFFAALAKGDAYAEHVRNEVCEAMLVNGEPGLWNSSKAAEGELSAPLATNPCGEISLQPWENCNLGHVNLDYFITPDGNVHYTDLFECHRLMTRFLMRATYGDVNDEKQLGILRDNRRIGVGHLGVQGFWAKQGIPYSEIATHPNSVSTLELLYKHVRQAARDYAFELRIPEPVKVTTVAPTGTIAKMPGVSEGIHPIYAKHFERRVRFSLRDAEQRAKVQALKDEGYRVETDQYDQSGMTAVVVFPTEDILMQQVRDFHQPDHVVQSAEDLTVRDMLGLQRLYQRYWADNGVSYTVNVRPGSVTPQELAELLTEYLPDLKGTTIMVDDSRPQAPYTRITRAEYLSAAIQLIEDSVDLECSTGACPVR